jgi:hypothetical protein
MSINHNFCSLQANYQKIQRNNCLKLKNMEDLIFGKISQVHYLVVFVLGIILCLTQILIVDRYLKNLTQIKIHFNFDSIFENY